MQVSDVMTEKVRTIGPTATLREAETYLSEYGVSGLPVVDEHLGLIGIVSESDIVRAVAAAAARDAERHEIARTVADVMTTQPLAVTPDMPLVRAAQLMAEHDVNRLPVVSNGSLVGIVSRADVVRALAAPDEETTIHIRTLLDELPLDAEQVDVAVAGGRVTLRGELEARRLAEFVVERVRRVPGVRSVDPQLTWRRDDVAAARSAAGADDDSVPEPEPWPRIGLGL